MAATEASSPVERPAWLGRSVKATALDQAPAIAEVMAEVGAIWTARFAELSATPAEMSFKGLRLGRIGQLLDERGGTPVCAAVRAPEWNAEVGLVLERRLVPVLIEALFGGEGDDGAPVEAAPLSAIERQIAQVFGRQVAEALEAGLAPHLPARLRFDRLLSKPDFGAMSKSDGVVGLVTLAVSALGRGGELDLLVPSALLDSIADALGTEPPPEPAEHDPRWSRQLTEEVGRAVTQLHAVIDMPAMSLGAILAMAPGQVLALPAGAGGKVRLSCGPTELFRCELGQLAGHYTVRVDEALAGACEPDRPHSHHLATPQ